MSNSNRDPDKEAFWRLVHQEYHRSGLTVREFCRKEGLTESSFFAWKRVLKERDSEATMLGKNDGSPNHGSPNHGSPNHGSPNHGSPNHGSPNHGSPNHGSPNHGSPNHGSPNHGSPNHGSPNHGSSKRGSRSAAKGKRRVPKKRKRQPAGSPNSFVPVEIIPSPNASAQLVSNELTIRTPAGFTIGLPSTVDAGRFGEIMDVLANQPQRLQTVHQRDAS